MDQHKTMLSRQLSLIWWSQSIQKSTWTHYSICWTPSDKIKLSLSKFWCRMRWSKLISRWSRTHRNLNLSVRSSSTGREMNLCQDKCSSNCPQPLRQRCIGITPRSTHGTRSWTATSKKSVLSATLCIRTATRPDTWDLRLAKRLSNCKQNGLWYSSEGRRLAWKACIVLQKAKSSAVCAWNLSVRQETSGSTLTTLTSEVNQFFSRRLRRMYMRMGMMQAKSLLWLILSKCEGCRGRVRIYCLSWIKLH